MRFAGIGRLLPVFLFFIQAAYASSINQTNYTAAQASVAINSTASFIQAINESGYLVFYPNLTQAYRYLGQARKVYASEPGTAAFYAGSARQAAQAAYDAIGAYRNASLEIMAAFTIAVAIVLYRFGRPVSAHSGREPRKG